MSRGLPNKTVEPMTGAPVTGFSNSSIVGGAPVMAHLARQGIPEGVVRAAGFAACGFKDFQQHEVVRSANSLRVSYEDIVHQFKAMREKRGVLFEFGCPEPGLS